MMDRRQNPFNGFILQRTITRLVSTFTWSGTNTRRDGRPHSLAGLGAYSANALSGWDHLSGFVVEPVLFSWRSSRAVARGYEQIYFRIPWNVRLGVRRDGR